MCIWWKNKSESKIILIKDWPYSGISWGLYPTHSECWYMRILQTFRHSVSLLHWGRLMDVFNQPQGGQTYILDFQRQDEFKSALISSTSTVAFVHISWSWVGKYSHSTAERKLFFFFYCFPLAQLFPFFFQTFQISPSSFFLVIFHHLCLSFLPKTLVPARRPHWSVECGWQNTSHLIAFAFFLTVFSLFEKQIKTFSSST